MAFNRLITSPWPPNVSSWARALSPVIPPPTPSSSAIVAIDVAKPSACFSAALPSIAPAGPQNSPLSLPPNDGAGGNTDDITSGHGDGKGRARVRYKLKDLLVSMSLEREEEDAGEEDRNEGRWVEMQATLLGDERHRRWRWRWNEEIEVQIDKKLVEASLGPRPHPTRLLPPLPPHRRLP